MKKFFALAGVLLLCGIIAAAVFRYREEKKKENARDGKKDKVIAVNVALPEKRTMRDERKFSGTAMAWSEFDIEPKVAGKLIELCYDIGDSVKEGSLIARIDDSEYVQQVRQEEANLDYARAKQKESESLVKTKRREFERQKTLLASNATSETLYEKAQSDLECETATLEMCRADVKRCEAQLSNARLKLADTRITAEWRSGEGIRHIGARYVDEGALLTVGKPVLSIVELTRMKAHIQIIERDYPHIRIGQKTEITTDAYPNETFEGTVTSISNMLSENTRSAVAVVTIDNPDLKLKPGMFLRARVLLGEHRDTQTVPLLAVIQKNDSRIVFRYENGKAVLTPVETGLSDGENIEIVSPSIATPVVTVGNHLLEDGRDIQISELSRAQMAEKAAGADKK